ncbi:hypothetical protein AVEN_23034-1 [Araneus ventricosus]|uniref:Uncharacterized protein n=1 Tax=Araneus ventricosus TaxID=182803 RepID=A0A4Y2LM83_ARAVE|nr:hypothetical protein AVEN_23034-1 [Araneus ventricosus]
MFSFVEDMAKYCGEKSIVYNVHNFLHIADDVRLVGWLVVWCLMEQEPFLAKLRQSNEKKYAIVCFVHESQVEVVPSSWLVNNSTVKWPNNCTITAIMKHIRECKLPEDSWNTISVRVLETFSRANHKATVAQDTSNIGTDSSQSEEETATRKRMRPQRFDSPTDDESEILKRGNNSLIHH